ncbi:MAG: winged helix-turn-helix transcriptional regulator [Gammaproteobacteria bacterium]
MQKFLGSPERITTNVLADRLALMEVAGLVAKAPYQLCPKRFEYILTQKGEALLPVLQAMCRWANHSIPGCPFRKLHPAWIRIVRQNHRIIECDVCNPARARNVRRRPVQVEEPA